MELVVPDDTAGHKTTIVQQDKVCLWPMQGGEDQMLWNDKGVSKNKSSWCCVIVYSAVIGWMFLQTSRLHFKLLVGHNLSV